MNLSPQRSCHGKLQYPTRKAAAAAAQSARAAFGGRWNTYRCPFCGYFHTGHITRGQLRAERKRRRRAAQYRYRAA